MRCKLEVTYTSALSTVLPLPDHADMNILDKLFNRGKGKEVKEAPPAKETGATGRPSASPKARKNQPDILDIGKADPGSNMLIGDCTNQEDGLFAPCAWAVQPAPEQAPKYRIII